LILGALAGISAEMLTDKHGPCPLCGGTDRYRFDDKDGSGSWFCNQCGGKNHSGGAGAGMDLLMRKMNWEFKDAIVEVERFLGVEKKTAAAPPVKAAENVWYYSDNFLVARFPGKRYRPFFFDGKSWKPGAINAPRPLLNHAKIKASTRTVIITEGEKACDAAAKLFPDLIATTWSSGCKSFRKTDFSILLGHSVLLWPDADAPGLQAMDQVAQMLLKLGVQKIAIVDPPDNVPAGWDLADASWTPAEAIEYAKQHNRIPELSSPEVEQQSIPVESSEEEPSEIDHGSHFTCLGFDSDSFFYQPHATGQVTRLSRPAHTSTNLVSLAPLEFWEGWAPNGKGSVDWVRAASMLFSLGADQGVYDPLRIRGRGAWWDKGRTVLHLGDRLIADNKIQPVNELFQSRYIYQRLSKLEGHGATSPLSDQESFHVLSITEQFLWENPTSGLLLAGWVALAPICGALQWRPHIWLTAAAGSGKSAILDRFVHPLLSDMGLFVVGNTTEAGIRQSLRSDAMPIIFDEAESNERADQARMQNILSLARVASSESQATAIKGSSTGEANRFHVRSMFMMSSISTHLKQGADRSRFAQLTLRNPASIQDNGQRSSHWEILDKMLDTHITREYGRALINRTVKLIPVIRETNKIFSRAFADIHGSQRQGDQYGTLLAGAWSLQSSEVIKKQDAIDIIQANNFDDFAEQTEISDEQKCLQHILQHQLRIDGDSRSLTRSVGELIQVVMGKINDFELDKAEAVRTLGRHGLRVEVEDRALYVSNSSKGLSAILADTSWANCYTTMLRRLKGSSAGGNWHFAGLGTSKSTRLDIDQI
jgi:putative DNA primase/helicase